MSRKRPHLFGGNFHNERNVLPRFARDIMPEMSASERAAWRTIKPHLVRFVQRRRGIIGSTVGAGAALAAEFIRSKAFGGTPRGSKSEPSDIPSSSLDTGTTDSESKSSVEKMTGATPMQIATHGDGATAAEEPFNRDATNADQQKAIAASLWNRAPKIYDDEIIVRLPFILTGQNAAAAQPMSWRATLATAGPPLVPATSILNQSAIKLNDIFTPYPFDTSFKPRGYSWYAQLYNLYQVLECRWKYHTVAISNTLATTDAINKDQPLEIYAQMSDNSHTVFADPRTITELGYTNGADKSIIIQGPAKITAESGKLGNVTNTKTFEGVWTPAQFEDLQTNITFQPMTAIGASPNWGNYLDFGYINYNTVNYTDFNWFQTKLYCEFLVHFKKVNMTKYATSN
jgi:hypothetical protein